MSHHHRPNPHEKKPNHELENLGIVLLMMFLFAIIALWLLWPLPSVQPDIESSPAPIPVVHAEAPQSSAVADDDKDWMDRSTVDAPVYAQNSPTTPAPLMPAPALRTPYRPHHVPHVRYVVVDIPVAKPRVWCARVSNSY